MLPPIYQQCLTIRMTFTFLHKIKKKIIKKDVSRHAIWNILNLIIRGVEKKCAIYGQRWNKLRATKVLSHQLHQNISTTVIYYFVDTLGWMKLF